MELFGRVIILISLKSTMIINEDKLNAAIKLIPTNIACGCSYSAYYARLESFQEDVIKAGYTLEEMWKFGYYAYDRGYPIVELTLPLVFIKYKELMS